MPEPKPLMTLSWEDIAHAASNMGEEISREQVIEAFDLIVQKGMDPEGGSYWDLVESETRAVISNHAERCCRRAGGTDDA